ncbi:MULTISPECIES: alanine dehydrogenase [Jeotgalicoccus]|uniref:Alanine dehydrogenase n=1 Tax=Jeotgalicoccus nanhaiensis TaxID=568603 RepID=A0ABR9XZB3_9STAP|nr:alanine dehydrogenase [Jeotgalicoccus nanhaiensis]MBF0754055.1 alanine dehydrogenase [Jeotgalicoccus nanhaiensis]TFU61541.1 alanine dehydrogenase [Jeotgalicoccus nanhaiensis]
MIIGIPKEVKNNENRVGLTPGGVYAFVQAGHTVRVEKNAGSGSYFEDEAYIEMGAEIVGTAAEAWDSEMVVKVKEPLAEEFDLIKEESILFTYLHLAPEEALTQVLVDKKVTAIAYETIQLPDGSLPLLAPMSEVAGRMAPQVGAEHLKSINGGKGILLSGVPGVEKAKVTIVGGGAAGTNAAKMAVGLGADVTILDLNPKRLRELDDLFGPRVQTLMSTPLNIKDSVESSDLVIGAVLIPGARAPKLVTEEMIKNMAPGSVIVDIAIDQGGIFETTDKITTHDDPTYVKHGVIHYAVANMPGAVPRTSTNALTNATLQYGLLIANNGYKEALVKNPVIAGGFNTFQGHVTYEAVAEAQNREYVSIHDLLK